MGAEQRPDFEWVVRQYRLPLRNFIFHQVRCQEDTEDLLQETLLRAYLRYDSFRGECRVDAWLYQIARSRCRDHWRWLELQRRCGRVEQPLQLPEYNNSPEEQDKADPGPSPLEILLGQELEAQVHRGMQELTLRQREAFFVSLQGRGELSAYAAREGITLIAARSRAHDGRRRVRACLTEYLEDTHAP